MTAVEKEMGGHLAKTLKAIREWWWLCGRAVVGAALGSCRTLMREGCVGRRLVCKLKAAAKQQRSG